MYSLLSKRIATFIKHHSCNIVAHSAVQNVLKTGEILSITIKAAIITIVELVFCGKSAHRDCRAEYSVTISQSVNQSINQCLFSNTEHDTEHSRNNSIYC